MEHRWGRRIAVDMPIQLNTPGMPLRRARIANLSVSGALIEADFTVRMRSLIQIVLELPVRQDRALLTIAAVVAHRHPQGIGVEWCEFGSPIVIALLRAVTAPPGNSASLDNIPRELEPQATPVTHRL